MGIFNPRRAWVGNPASTSGKPAPLSWNEKPRVSIAGLFVYTFFFKIIQRMIFKKMLDQLFL